MASTKSTTSASSLSDFANDAASSTSSAPPSQIDPACIIGMACRVPGAATPSKLWDNIIGKVDLQRKMPSDRFNVDAFYHPDGTHKGTTNARFGYFLDQDISLFDAGFFHISGREAEAMDPQQRILLEVVYEALENAGITLDEIRGSQTSVFCGTFTNDYMSASTKDSVYYPQYTVTGTGNAILSNRISYFYDLHGPSATIDTACSSSLVCLHLGNQTLNTGEADIAIVVGSALHYDPRIYVEMTDLGMLSSDGRCRHGDAKGSGYVRGEGITALVLKRRRQSLADGHRIRAVVRATGVNHDGSKQGITLPSDIAQADLIRRVYKTAGLEPLNTQYVECHGTGTKAGDPRELRALGSVFAPGRQSPLWVGSIKTNIGHLEGASGIAGIIKATLALELRQIPPNMHFEEPNPEIDFQKWKLKIPTETMEWKTEGIRRASVNSFGYGGTNAHVILEEYCSEHSPVPSSMVPGNIINMVKDRPYLLPLTSHTPRAGHLMAAKFSHYIRTSKNFDVASLAATLCLKRTMHSVRSFAIESTAKFMANALDSPPPVANWTSKMEAIPRLGFVFTGQGAQWFAMGRQLLEKCPLFLQTLQKCDRILASLTDGPKWSIVEELLRSKDTTRLGKTSFSQPICTALQLAILDLIKQWGIKPSAVVGHSSGEIAAAYSAGFLNFENALIAAYYRGLHMGSAAQDANSMKGAMMAIGLSESETISELQAFGGRLAIAAMNSPVSFTISGDEDAIIELQSKLTERKVFARRLQVEQAFHSHHMTPLAPAYQAALTNHINFRTETPSALMVSSVTARIVEADTMDPAYFTANMTGTVRFSDALTGIILDDEDVQQIDLLIEIGPHPALKGPTKQTLDSLKLSIPYISSLDRNQPAMESLLALAGQLFAHGYPVDLLSVNQDLYYDEKEQISRSCTPQLLTNLPTYSWDHEQYWSETRIIKDNRLRKSNHEILGARIPGSLAQRPRYRNHLRLTEMPWLADHSIDGKVVFPGAGYINMAIEAAFLLQNDARSVKQFYLRDISVKSALVVSSKNLGTEILLEISAANESAKSSSSDWYQFAIHSFDESEQLHEHCTGLISIEYGEATKLSRESVYLPNNQSQIHSNRSLSTEKYYAKLAKIGLKYGPTFQLLTQNLEIGPGFAQAPIAWKPELFSKLSSDISIIHPALLDAAFHPLFAAIETQLGTPLSEPFVPTFVKSLKISGLMNERKSNEKGFQGHTSTRTSLRGHRVAINSVQLEADGDLLVDIEGLELTSLGGVAGEDSTKRTLFFGEKWKPIFDLLDLCTESSNTFSLASLIDFYAHQHPNCRILHYSNSYNETLALLSTLGGKDGVRRRFQMLQICPETSSEVQLFNELTLNYTGLVAVGQPDNAPFDVIVTSRQTKVDEALLLAGSSILVTPPGISQPFESLRKLYNGHNCAVWAPFAETVSTQTTITLIMPDKESPQATSIACAIESCYQSTVQKRSLSDLGGTHNVGGTVVVLASLDDDLFFSGTDSNRIEFDAVKALRKTRSTNVVWLTQGGLMDANHPEHAILLGLLRTLRSENETLRLVHFDISTNADPSTVAIQTISFLLRTSFSEDEICERAGILYSSRCEPNDELNAKLPNGFNNEVRLEPLHQEGRPLTLRVAKPGLLDSISFVDDLDIMNEPLRDDEIEITVRASAINFRDIAAGMGIIADHKFGDECAGVVRGIGRAVSSGDFQVGDRVVAWRPGQGAHKIICRNPASLCYKLTDDMSFAAAAAIPLILTTAYFSLLHTAKLQPGDVVLIHAAAGGVGQMAVQLAQMVGAKIIATVGSIAKRDLLKTTYGLIDEQIFSSRDDSFVQGIMDFTKGRGVDVVLNSLAGKLLHCTWNCMAPFGRFIEIGKRDIHQNTRIEMDPFRRNVIFASVDLVTMFEQNKSLGAQLLRECCQLVNDGSIRPPSNIVELPYAEAEKGFRLLQQGKIAGKIVLVPGIDDQVMVQPSRFTNKQLFQDHKTYLLVGGLGGLGRSLSEWLYRKGARSLAFLSRSGDRSQDATDTVNWLRARKVKVTIFMADVVDFDRVQSCVDAIGPNLAGVFQAAMILQDAPLDTMTFQQWQLALLPKVRGTYNLHKATLNHKLDFFVCFSSVSAIVGSRGQANYAAANSYIDALCQFRRSLGLAASTMNVGMITGIGAVSENATLRTIMERIGYDGVNEEELFAQIENAVTCDQTKRSTPGQFQAHQTITGVNLARDDFYWVSKPYFRNVYQNHDFAVSVLSSTAKVNVMAHLRKAVTAEDKEIILTDAFIDKVANILSVERDSIQPVRGLADYGLDSIVAVEIRKWFFKIVQVDLAVFDILGSKSIRALIQKAVSLLALDDIKSKAKEAKKTTADLNQLPAVDMKFVVDSDQITIPQYNLDDIPMSTFQKRLWFAHNIAENPAFLNLQVTKHITGTPDVLILKKAFSEVKKRNEILRTCYFEGDDFAQQEIMSDWSVNLPSYDLSSYTDPSAALQQRARDMKDEPLDIEEGQVFRIALFKLGVQKYALVGVYHHIAVDRGCTSSVLEQMVTIYDALKSSSDLNDIPRPAVSYADFAVWHSEHLLSLKMQEHISFWKKMYHEAVEPSKLLPFAKAMRPTENDFKRQAHREVLKPSMLNRMKRISARLGATPAQFLLATFRAFLFRYTEEEDMTIHMIDGNRPHPDVNDTVGFFVNVVPIRTSIKSAALFESVLDEVKRKVLAALEHSSVPFDAIVDQVGTARNTAYFPLGQVAFNYQMHGTVPVYQTQDFEIASVEAEDIPSACELNIEIVEDPAEGLKIRLESSSTLYDCHHVERFLDNFVEFLTNTIKDHRRPINEISLCGDKELLHLKSEFFNTATKSLTWDQSTIMSRIKWAVERYPNAIAIETSEGESITYQALLKNSLAIAGVVQRSGALPGDRVAIYSRPGIAAVSAMIATVASRCAYVALDLDFAEDRLAFMLADSASKVLLTTHDIQLAALELVRRSGADAKVRSIESAIAFDTPGIFGGCENNDPFYMIYTSGSTGIPKGVILSHSNTHNMLNTLCKDYQFCATDHFLQHSSLCFDLSVVQIFSALTCGGRVCIASAPIRKDPHALAQYIKDCKATITYFTPTQFGLLLEHARLLLSECKQYRIAYFAGERLPVRIAKAFYDLKTSAIAYNTWSPSELVVQTTIQKVAYPDDDQTSIPIGYPMDNTRHYILDTKCQPLPEGFIGEIVVGGAQVGLGYLNRPEENKKSFVVDPFCSPSDKSRGWTQMFRTGDRGRFRSDGSLEFHGRIAGDKQVKLRGYRIDLGEVEQRLFVGMKPNLSKHSLIDITVIARPIDPNINAEEHEDQRQIIAYVVTKTPLSITAKKDLALALHELGSKHLNNYMLPNGYEFLERLPTTIGGKVDRQKLLKMNLNLIFPVRTTNILRNNVEEESSAASEHTVKIIALFRDVLKLPDTTNIDSDSNFFELGGQSILMLRLQARIKRTLKANLSLNSMFKAASPAGIAALLQTPGLKKASVPALKAAEEVVNWENEILLKNGSEWEIAAETILTHRSDYTHVLLTGVDFFIGIHALTALLAGSPDTIIYVLGSQRTITFVELEELCIHYKLFNETITREVLNTRVVCISSSLETPRFGLSDVEFKLLGFKIDSIWHLGGTISLLKSYLDLKKTNVDPLHDLISLAAASPRRTEINYLSTWSVPHLQTWNSSRRFPIYGGTITTEAAADHFEPEGSGRYGYFKSRWVAEMILHNAAKRGFQVNIIRASAVTAHTIANVTEPKDDFIRRMVLSMMEIGAVFDNQLLSAADVPFAIDFIPVDYLTKAMYALLMLDRSQESMDSTQPENEANIFHIGNPFAITYTDLPDRSRTSTPGSKVRKVPLEDWLTLAAETDGSPGAKLRWAVLRDYISMGHNMFALDRAHTKLALEAVGVKDEDCPPVDEYFLNALAERDAQE